MLIKVISSSVLGVNGYIVDVEVDMTNGLPNFAIVGLGDTAILESRDRIKSAVKNSGLNIAPKRIVVNLSPADIRKEGSSFDLPIAVGILACGGQIKQDLLEKYMIVGELSLGGEVKRVKGIINSVITAKENGVEGIIVPYANYSEASIIDGVDVVAVKDLKDLIQFFNEGKRVESEKIKNEIEEYSWDIDFSEVKGQGKAKRALEISAAGGHNILMMGSPGSGKSMLAKRMPTIMPEMEYDEMVECTKIYSSAGRLNDKMQVVNKRPFRSPHHTSSDVALIGGGRFPKPGEISLAHNGILFLDEIGEYSKQVLEVLRQPLEDRVVTVSRATHSVEFPADFLLLAAGNPCYCGYLYEDESSSKVCTCSPHQIHNYQKKISGPILDRMDIYLEIKKIRDEDLISYAEGESSKLIKERIIKARTKQYKRYKSVKTNSRISEKEIRKYCKLDEETELIMKAAIKNLSLSGRGFGKILRVARTIADLNGEDNIKKEHLLEAISYRKS